MEILNLSKQQLESLQMMNISMEQIIKHQNGMHRDMLDINGQQLEVLNQMNISISHIIDNVDNYHNETMSELNIIQQKQLLYFQKLYENQGKMFQEQLKTKLETFDYSAARH